MLGYVGDHREEVTTSYGNISAQSLGAILRALLPLEREGGGLFFGEPDLDIRDWFRTAPDGRGMVNVLDCVKLVQNPTLYASFLLWMLSELFEVLPEAGDLDRPKLVFFFDEAHMLFSGAPKALVQKIEQVVKLIRSKGVGVYFVTQSPSDIPDSVLAQLSNRVQHALRAYTPAEQKAVKAAAQAFRENPAFKAADVIMELGVGEALVSVLDGQGVPGMVQRTAIVCPQSLMAPAPEATRQAALSGDGMGKYDKSVDSESAYELLQKEQEEKEKQAALDAERAAFEKEKAAFEAQKAKEEAAAQKKAEKEAEAQRKKLEKALEREEAQRQRAAERRKAQLERQLINAGAQVLKRGLMGTLFGGRSGRK